MLKKKVMAFAMAVLFVLTSVLSYAPVGVEAEESEMSIVFSEECQEQTISAGDYTVQYTPEEDGYYALMANGKGCVSCESEDWERCWSEAEWNSSDELQLVYMYYLEGGKIYNFYLNIPEEQTMGIGLVPDSLEEVSLKTLPKKQVFLSGSFGDEEGGFAVDLSGLEVSTVFSKAGELIYTYGEDNDIVSWDGSCKGIVETEEGIYLKEGTWDYNLYVNNTDKTLSFTIEIIDIESIDQELSSQTAKYETGSGMYVVYTPETTGYYGLISEECGEIYFSSLFRTNMKKISDTSKCIEALMWLKEGTTYAFYMYSEESESMNLAMKPLEVTSADLVSKYGGNYASDHELVFDDVTLTMHFSNGDTYVVDESDYYLSDMNILFKNHFSSNMPVGGENAIEINCHLENNPSVGIMVESVKDKANEKLKIGTTTITSASDVTYYLLTIEKDGYYTFTVTGIEYTYIYRADNKYIDSLGVEDSNTISCDLVAGEYVLKCEEIGSNAEISITDTSAKELKITNYKECFIEGIDFVGQNIEVDDALTFTITDAEGEEEEYYDEWLPSDVIICVDGIEWNEYSDDDYSALVESGEHTVTVRYRGVSGTYTYSVISYEDYISEFTSISDGANNITLDTNGSDSIKLSYQFVPKESKRYTIDVEGAPSAYYWSVTGKEGWISEGNYEEENETAKLEAGKTYLFEVTLENLTETSYDLSLNIVPRPAISKIEVTKGPDKDTFFVPMEEVGVNEIKAGIALSVTYEDGTSEKHICDGDDEAFFEKNEIEIINNDLYLNETGEYTCYLRQNTCDFEYSFVVKVICYDDAVTKGLIESIDVTKSQELTIGTEESPCYYILEGYNTGNYFFTIGINEVENVTEAIEDKTVYFEIYDVNFKEEVGSSIYYGRTSKMHYELDKKKEYIVKATDYTGELTDEKISLKITGGKEIESISLHKEQDATEYYRVFGYSTFDLRGIQLLVKYSDDTEEIMEYGTDSWYDIGTFMRDELYVSTDGKMPVGYYWFNGLPSDEPVFRIGYTVKTTEEYPKLYDIENNSTVEVTSTCIDDKTILKIVPTEDAEYTISSSGTVDTYGELTNPSYFEYGKDDNSGVGKNFEITADLKANNTYYLIASSYDEGTFKVSITDEKHTHTYGDWTEEKAATCEENGVKIRTCSECGATETQKIQSLGHEYSDEFTVDTEATNTSAGSKSRHCSRTDCDARTDITMIPATGTIYEQTDAIVEKDASELTEIEKEQVTNIVEEIVKATENGEDIESKMNAEKLIALEQLYVASNDSVGETVIDGEMEGVNTADITVEGAAITVQKYLPEDSVTTYQSKITIVNALAEEIASNGELAASVKAGTAYVLDINMSIVNSEGKTVDGASDVQPVVPVRITIPLPEEWADSDFKLYHYDDEGNVAEVTYEITEKDGKKCIVFTASSFSYYVLEKEAEEVHEHNFTLKETVSPTCTAKGYDIYVCSCGETENRNEVAASGHNFGTAWKTDSTNHWHVCSCGEKDSVAKHTFKWVIDKEASTSAAGSKHEECTVCGTKRKEGTVIAQLHGHSYGTEWKTDATNHWHVCSCGEKDSNAVHTFKWITDKAATTTATGIKHEECDVCGYKRNENTVIDKLPVPAGTKLNDTKNKVNYKVTDAGTVEYTKTSSKSTKITVPATVTIDGTSYKVTSIAANAFKNNKKITQVKIGDNITSIGANAFSGCTKLKTLTIGKNVTSIGSKAFYKCSKLTKVTIPTSVKTIGTSAFQECKKLKTVNMGSNVTTIGDKAFYKCTVLAKITIPSKVTKIGKQAFYGCKKLKYITIKTTKLTSKNVGSKAFKGIYSKATIKVPKSKLSAYKKLLKSKGVSKKAKIKK